MIMSTRARSKKKNPTVISIQDDELMNVKQRQRRSSIYLFQQSKRKELFNFHHKQHPHLPSIHLSLNL
jgi:uncharacterized protein YqeY